MSQYIASPREWVADQVELYEKSGGTKGLTLRDTGLPVIIVTNQGCKTGAIRKTPLMRVNCVNCCNNCSALIAKKPASVPTR